MFTFFYPLSAPSSSSAGHILEVGKQIVRRLLYTCEGFVGMCAHLSCLSPDVVRYAHHGFVTLAREMLLRNVIHLKCVFVVEAVLLLPYIPFFSRASLFNYDSIWHLAWGYG